MKQILIVGRMTTASYFLAKQPGVLQDQRKEDIHEYVKVLHSVCEKHAKELPDIHLATQSQENLPRGKQFPSNKRLV